jgi:hypothetical protein
MRLPLGKTRSIGDTMRIGELKKIIESMSDESEIIIQHPSNPLQEIKIRDAINYADQDGFKNSTLIITTKWEFETR